MMKTTMQSEILNKKIQNLFYLLIFILLYVIQDLY